MKICIISEQLLDRSVLSNKCYEELTDEEILSLCENDQEGIHNVFESVKDLADSWNCEGVEDLIWPENSYMRVIED